MASSVVSANETEPWFWPRSSTVKMVGVASCMAAVSGLVVPPSVSTATETVCRFPASGQRKLDLGRRAGEHRHGIAVDLDPGSAQIQRFAGRIGEHRSRSGQPPSGEIGNRAWAAGQLARAGQYGQAGIDIDATRAVDGLTGQIGRGECHLVCTLPGSPRGPSGRAAGDIKGGSRGEAGGSKRDRLSVGIDCRNSEFEGDAEFGRLPPGVLSTGWAAGVTMTVSCTWLSPSMALTTADC